MDGLDRTLDRLQACMLTRHVCYCNGGPSLHYAAIQHNAHHPGLADQAPIWQPIQNCGKQPSPKALDLRARIAQASHLDKRVAPEKKPRSRGQIKQIHTASCDVLSQVPGRDRKPSGLELSEQLFVQQVDLPQVRLTGVLRDARAVHHSLAAVGIAANAMTLDQFDFAGSVLGERVLQG